MEYKPSWEAENGSIRKSKPSFFTEPESLLLMPCSQTPNLMTAELWLTALNYMSHGKGTDPYPGHNNSVLSFATYMLKILLKSPSTIICGIMQNNICAWNSLTLHSANVIVTGMRKHVSLHHKNWHVLWCRYRKEATIVNIKQSQLKVMHKAIYET
jgi:hypothetical protein